MGLLREGQSIRGTYEVERLVGEGAFAEVYRVRHRFLGRQAMKVFKTVGMTVAEIEDMLGEAILLSRIGHPNLIRVFDANTTETSRGICGFFTTEYIAGGSLEQFWRSHGTNLVPVETAVEITRQVCRGLAVAHREDPPIIHRDIKPQNILIGYEGDGLRARVCDFGLAKRVNPLTMLASARGTRSFKSPEAFLDPQRDSCAGDVWAVGSTLYLLLTDRLPLAEGGELDVMDPTRFDRPVIPPSRLNLKVDPLLDQIALRALAFRPEDRYPNAQQMLMDLDAWRPAPPAAAGGGKRTIASETSKVALGAHTPPDEEEARKLVRRALAMAANPGQLGEAADLMEEAINRWPEIRAEHEYRLKLWRRGLVM
jgi:serine/threonine-protein kinase